MRFLLVAALAMVVGGCALGGSEPPPSPAALAGLTRDQAIAAARHAEPFDRVISATAGRIGSFEPRQSGVPGDRMVWAIVVTGSFQGELWPCPLLWLDASAVSITCDAGDDLHRLHDGRFRHGIVVNRTWWGVGR